MSSPPLASYIPSGHSFAVVVGRRTSTGDLESLATVGLESGRAPSRLAALSPDHSVSAATARSPPTRSSPSHTPPSRRSPTSPRTLTLSVRRRTASRTAASQPYPPPPIKKEECDDDLPNGRQAIVSHPVRDRAASLPDNRRPRTSSTPTATVKKEETDFTVTDENVTLKPSVVRDLYYHTKSLKEILDGVDKEGRDQIPAELANKIRHHLSYISIAEITDPELQESGWFPTTIFKSVGITRQLKRVMASVCDDESLFGDGVSEAAKTIFERWKHADYKPRPLAIEEEEEVEEGEEVEIPSSESPEPTMSKLDRVALGAQRTQERLAARRAEELARMRTSTYSSGGRVSRIPSGKIRNYKDQGVRDIMQGVICFWSTKRWSYKKDESRWSLVKRDFDRIGHNGLAVGDWWPLRLCAIRDGAHGAIMAGIAGTEASGAYSVVVSGSNQEYANDDGGDEIWYFGSKAEHHRGQKKPGETADTKCLRVSWQRAQPVRVLRAGPGRSRYAPQAGLRYDGLYDVVTRRIKGANDYTGDPGQWQFLLRRRGGQKPLSELRNIPTHYQCRLAEIIKAH